MKPVEVRSKLVDALGLDLIGPDRGSEHAAEVLPQAPSRWYLTGFLVPLDAAEVQQADETASEGDRPAERCRRPRRLTDAGTQPPPVGPSSRRRWASAFSCRRTQRSCR